MTINFYRIFTGKSLGSSHKHNKNLIDNLIAIHDISIMNRIGFLRNEAFFFLSSIYLICNFNCLTAAHTDNAYSRLRYSSRNGSNRLPFFINHIYIFPSYLFSFIIHQTSIIRNTVLIQIIKEILQSV